MSAVTTATGFSPDGQFQPSSLPSSVSDPLEGVIGQSFEDLSLDELDPNMGGANIDNNEVGVV